MFAFAFDDDEPAEAPPLTEPPVPALSAAPFEVIPLSAGKVAWAVSVSFTLLSFFSAKKVFPTRVCAAGGRPRRDLRGRRGLSKCRRLVASRH